MIGKKKRRQLKAPQGSDLAKARMAAHAAFDPLWQTKRFSRGVAYEWLASRLGIAVAQCHMILFDIATCQKVVEICGAHPECQKAAFELAASDFEELA